MPNNQLFQYQSRATPLGPDGTGTDNWQGSFPAQCSAAKRRLGSYVSLSQVILVAAAPVASDVQEDKFTLGSKESLSVTSQPTIGGRWSW